MSDLFDDQARDDEAKRDRLKALGWTHYRYNRDGKWVWVWSGPARLPYTEAEAFAWLGKHEAQ